MACWLWLGLLSNFFLIAVTTATTNAAANLAALRPLDAQQDERIRLECTVTLKSDAEEAIWMRIRLPQNPDILTYRDRVIYAPERIELEQRVFSSGLNENGTFTEIYYLTLTILRPNIDDEGRYICINRQKVFAEYDLFVIVPPQFLDETSSVQQQTLLEGSTLELSCSANGRPKPSITWFYRTNDGKHISLADGKGCQNTICELRLGNYSRSDPTIIECVADNNKSTRISKVFNVDVHYPPKLNTTVRSFRGSRSIDVLLQCSFVANPPAVSLWLDQKKQEINDSDLYTIQTNNELTTLAFSVFPEDHPSTFFYCRSNNSAGVEEKLINIAKFIQFDSMTIQETTTATVPSTSSPINNSLPKKRKTARPHHVRSRPSTTTFEHLQTSTSAISSSSANSLAHFSPILLLPLLCFL